MQQMNCFEKLAAFSFRFILFSIFLETYQQLPDKILHSEVMRYSFSIDIYANQFICPYHHERSHPCRSQQIAMTAAR